MGLTGRTARRAGAGAGAGAGAVVVAVLALGAAACTGQDGAGGAGAQPTAGAHRVVLPGPAPASAQWIVDELAALRQDTSLCPVPALANMIVFDDGEDAPGQADVAWLEDDSYVCFGTLTRDASGLGKSIHGEPIDTFAAREVPLWIGGSRRISFLAAFPGDVGTVVRKYADDDDDTYGPLHQRVVGLGGGRSVTLVQYSYPHELPSSGDEIRLCPSDGDPCKQSIH
ncbi:hypothetical protein ABTY61_36560 [Kitasatospora sp. NPDC096128]|uniref:hypothetical protein n=1 Tax=Kitasatospora sp. NPDC096128 TaxID=3155547 RepID=UPI0033204810